MLPARVFVLLRFKVFQKLGGLRIHGFGRSIASHKALFFFLWLGDVGIRLELCRSSCSTTTGDPTRFSIRSDLPPRPTKAEVGVRDWDALLQTATQSAGVEMLRKLIDHVAEMNGQVRDSER